MPNTLLTPKIIAKEALMVLRNSAVLSKLVHRDYTNEFVAGVGNTITVRKPAKFVANEFTSAIQIQDATEEGVDVKMDKHLDVSFAVTSEDLTLDISDFSKQFLIPAMQAFNDKIDTYLITEAAKTVNSITQSKAVTKGDMIKARAFLTKVGAPLTDRSFVYSSEVESDLLNTDLFINASAVGDEGTALREASIGRKFGMDCYVDQNVDSSAVKAIALHKNALALVTRPLAIPAGASKASIVNYDGFGLRVVYGYDMTKKTDTISIDMLCGVATLDGKLVSKIVAA